MPFDVAHRFIDDCEQLGFVILGADFVIHDNSGIRQVPTVVDYATGAEPTAEEAATDLREFIRDGFPDGANEISFVIDRPA